MKYTLKLITTDKSLLKWRSLPTKLREINKELANIQGGELAIEIEYRDLIPTVHNGRVTHDWMDGLSGPLRQAGYAFVAFHMSDAQRTKFGIKPTLRGSYQQDFDIISEFYLWADEDTKRGRFNQFIQVFLHEFRHAFMTGCGLPDDTHELHDDDGDIRGSFFGLRWELYRPDHRNMEQQISLLRQVVSVLGKLVSLGKRRTSLFDAALAYLGKDASPSDIAPDALGCAESVSMIIRDVLPGFPIYTGTWSLNERLKSDPRFEAISRPEKGAIIMSPTGMGDTKKVSNGHVGIIVSGEPVGFKIASNDSATGEWRQNYDLASWVKRWDSAGYPVLLYKLKQ